MPETKLYIKNLDFGVTTEVLKAAFSEFGSVHFAKVVTKETATGSQSRGFGYVSFANAAIANEAIAGMHNQEILGRKISVSLSNIERAVSEKKEKRCFAFDKSGECKFGDRCHYTHYEKEEEVDTKRLRLDEDVQDDDDADLV